MSSDESSFLWVASYTQFSNLAHAPRGTPSKYSLMSVRLDEATGALQAIMAVDGIMNPAFIRHHPQRDLVYVATESIESHGEVCSFAVDRATGALQPLAKHSAAGASTCYLTVSPDCRHLLFVNYWDSTLGVMSLGTSGVPDALCSVQPPPAPVRASGLADHLANRQSEPHAHAIVLDPVHGRIAFVPDLGTDEIRLYAFDADAAALKPAGGKIPCAPSESGPHGPRYIEFDPIADAAYVVNELSSTVSLFAFDRSAAAALADATLRADAKGIAEAREAVLRFVGLYSTRPSPPPAKRNTCGRIAVDPSGGYVLVSNRGDDSIASFRIDRDGAGRSVVGLTPLQIVSTHGETPRHFQFSRSGRYVVAANQDSDTLAVLRLDQCDGSLEFTGHTLSVASPNFVCAAPSAASNFQQTVLRAPVPASKSGEF